MTLPRLSIIELMAVVALFAFDCAAFGVLARAEPVYPELVGLIGLGVLPMANVLVVGLLPLLRGGSGRCSHFRAGFEAFGGAALLLFLSLTLLASHGIHQVIDAAVRPLVPPMSPVIHIVLPILLMPQLAFALLGGWLNRRFEVTVTRRAEGSVVDPGPVVVRGVGP